MKLFVQGLAILALLIANASATQSGIFAANGVELEVYQSGEDIIYGEPVSLYPLNLLYVVTNSIQQSLVQVHYRLTPIVKQGHFLTCSF